MTFSLAGFAAVPTIIRLEDGRTLEGVTAANMDDGKVRVKHSGGVSRHAVSDVSLASRRDLGLLPKDKPAPIIPELVSVPDGKPIPMLWTVTGKHFQNVRAVKILNPSEISFTHDGGILTLRMDQLEREIRPNYSYDKAKSAEYDAQVAAIAADKAALDAERSRLAAEIAQKEELLAAKLAQRQRVDEQAAAKREAVQMLYRTTYGTESYWEKSARERQLYDAMTAAWLRKGGLSEGEIRNTMRQAQLR